MWWQDLLWGFWNGLTAWVVFIAHLFGVWQRFPFYNVGRDGGWYDFGFLIGAGSPLLGAFNGSRSAARTSNVTSRGGGSRQVSPTPASQH